MTAISTVCVDVTMRLTGLRLVFAVTLGVCCLFVCLFVFVFLQCVYTWTQFICAGVSGEPSLSSCLYLGDFVFSVVEMFSVSAASDRLLSLRNNLTKVLQLLVFCHDFR